MAPLAAAARCDSAGLDPQAIADNLLAVGINVACCDISNSICRERAYDAEESVTGLARHSKRVLPFEGGLVSRAASRRRRHGER